MEVRVNKEIRDYTESMFFGLSLRQFVFSVLTCLIAVAIYFGLRPVLGMETTSWLCIVAAFPLAVLGFLKYNGMTAERFIWAWVRSNVLMPKVLTFGNTNLYYKIIEDEANDKSKGKRKQRNGLNKAEAMGRKGRRCHIIDKNAK